MPSNFLRQKKGYHNSFMEGISFILSVIQNYDSNWSSVTEESCKLEKLVGNSNKVFVISTSLNVNPKRFIYRIFGLGETLNLNSCSSIFQILALRNIAPKIYYEGPHYRLEEYLEGTRNIQREEYLQPSMIEKVAKKLKEFHSQDLSDTLDSSTPVCISNATKWKSLAQSHLSKINNSRRQTEVNQAIEALNDTYYNFYLDVLPKDSPLSLTHMDTSFLNFLYREEKEEVCIIDFDYTGYSYKAFDIATLLQDIKYDYNYPEYPYYKYNPTIFPGDEILVKYVKAYGEGVEMFIDCKRCMIAAHYLWAIWALTLHEENGVGMDMLGYGLLRFREFLEGYKEFKNSNLDTMRRQSMLLFN